MAMRCTWNSPLLDAGFSGGSPTRFNIIPIASHLEDRTKFCC